MSFLPKTMGLAGGLIDGKPGALSNVGNAVMGPISPLSNNVQRAIAPQKKPTLEPYGGGPAWGRGSKALTV